MTEPITSIHNPRIQQLRDLMSKRSAREEAGLFVVEGVRLSEEALAHGYLPGVLFISDQASPRARQLEQVCRSKGVEVLTVSTDLLTRIADTENTQGVVMLLTFLQQPLPAQLDFVVILDQVRDPGNTGTILRTAAAAGVQAVILPPGNADVFSPKVVRAGMGAHFHVSILTADWTKIQHICRQREKPLKLLLAESGGGKSCWQHDLKQPIALVIGGEAEGASEEARKLCDDLIYIPMPGKFESLNAAVAASILMFETVRQRSQ